VTLFVCKWGNHHATVLVLICARSVTAFLVPPWSQRPGQGPRSPHLKAGPGLSNMFTSSYVIVKFAGVNYFNQSVKTSVSFHSDFPCVTLPSCWVVLEWRQASALLQLSLNNIRGQPFDKEMLWKARTRGFQALFGNINKFQNVSRAQLTPLGRLHTHRLFAGFRSGSGRGVFHTYRHYRCRWSVWFWPLHNKDVSTQK
jgi:hypothetical protein